MICYDQLGHLPHLPLKIIKIWLWFFFDLRCEAFLVVMNYLIQRFE